MCETETLQRLPVDASIASFFSYVNSELPDVATHCVRTARVADSIASELSLPREERELLIAAALLHDIGKIWIPKCILHKPSSLDSHETTVMMDHVILGPRYLSRFEGHSRLAAIVGQHHERFNGTGYPNGIAGLDIDPLARVLSVADAFCAATENRPYQSARDPYVTRNWIALDRARAFDPEVVSAFERLDPSRLAIRSGTNCSRLWLQGSLPT
jgi:putative two-component system response regulator